MNAASEKSAILLKRIDVNLTNVLNERKRVQKMSNILKKILAPLKSFFEEIKSSSETVFLALLILHMCVFYEGKINWSANEMVMTIFGAILQMGTMLASAAFLIYLIIRWKYAWNTKVFFLVPAIALFVLPIVFNVNGDTNWYIALTDLFFCLMAYGKDYKKILRCFMWTAFAGLLIAAAGLPLGLTVERGKIGMEQGFSLGTVYPNTWGQIAFLVLVVFWYLFLQKKRVVTFIIFIATGLFMYFVPECKTIALLSAVFPFLSLLVKPRVHDQTLEASPNKKGRVGHILLSVFPFVCFAVTMILCWQMDWVKKNTYSNYSLVTMGMRFVQGGIAFQHYGFPLIGHTLPNDPSIVSVVNGEAEVLYVVDSAFVTYSLFLGAIWMLWALCWLTYANWKGLKNKDGALVLMSGFIMVFAIMERPGLVASYNFMFLYPLASVAYLNEPEEKLSLRSLFGLSGNTAKQSNTVSMERRKQRSKKSQW